MFTTINKALDASRLKREDNEKGFTLIELLVVVIIIGILAAIAIPVFLNQRESAWKASVQSDLKNAAVVLETYATNNNGKYPTATAANVATATSLTYTPSADNTVTVTSTAAGYTITGENSNLADSADTLTYVSTAGGLQKTWS